MIGYLLLLCAASPALPPVEADTLLTQMDARIAAAKSLRIEFEVWGEGDKPWVKGSLAIAERNRFRCELRFRDEPKGPAVLVGDGKRMSVVSGDKAEILPMPNWYTEVMKSWLGRGGTFLSIWKVARFGLQTPAGKAPGPGSGPRLSKVRLSADERVNGVELWVVGYDLAGEKDDLPDAHGRVWIDPKTKLPVRRELDFGFGIPGARTKAKPSTAVHTKFEIDPKLDDKLFELPTEADLLLAQMDANICAAKTLRIEFEIRHQGWNEPEKKSLVLADRNRFRFEDWHEIRLRGESKRVGGVIVSDGKRMGTVTDAKPEFRTVPEWHNEVLKSWLGLGGTYLSAGAAGHFVAAPGGKKPGPDDGPRVSKARLLPDETSNGVKCRVVGYDLTWRLGIEKPTHARVRVWINPKTKLPVRREMTFRNPDPEGPFTAVHTKFEIDPKLDDKQFELPK